MIWGGEGLGRNACPFSIAVWIHVRHLKSEHGYFTILVLKPNVNQGMLQHIRFYSFCAKNTYLIFQIRRSDRKTKGKQTACVIASRQPIGSLTHECNQEWLPDLPCPAGELVIVHWRRRKWVVGEGRGWGGGGYNIAGEIHDGLSQNLVD